MTIDHPDDLTALLKGTFQLTLQDPAGHIFPVHIPVVDLPEEVMKNVPNEEKWRGLDVHLGYQAVVICLN